MKKYYMLIMAFAIVFIVTSCGQQPLAMMSEEESFAAAVADEYADDAPIAKFLLTMNNMLKEMKAIDDLNQIGALTKDYQRQLDSLRVPFDAYLKELTERDSMKANHIAQDLEELENRFEQLMTAKYEHIIKDVKQ